MSKTRASGFITGSKHLPQKLRSRAFICFSVFGTRDEALALFFDILLQAYLSCTVNSSIFEDSEVYDVYM